MTPSHEDVVGALRASLKERELLRQENERLQAGATEPVAIVGMACRFPGGVRSPEDLGGWSRANATLARSRPRTVVGTLERLYDPDAERAGTRDRPPRRLPARRRRVRRRLLRHLARARRWPWTRSSGSLLETAWEALERAGIDPRSLRGSAHRRVRRRHVRRTTARSARPSRDGRRRLPASPAARRASSPGRIAYVLGLEGPAVTVDTACSSSLVALHLAVPGAASAASARSRSPAA